MLGQRREHEVLALDALGLREPGRDVGRHVPLQQHMLGAGLFFSQGLVHAEQHGVVQHLAGDLLRRAPVGLGVTAREAKLAHHLDAVADGGEQGDRLRRLRRLRGVRRRGDGKDGDGEGQQGEWSHGRAAGKRLRGS